MSGAYETGHDVSCSVNHERQPREAAPMVAEEHEEPILKHFRWVGLSEPMQAVSRPFFILALQIMRLPRCAERTVALRKLLEAKDCCLRAALG